MSMETSVFHNLGNATETAKRKDYKCRVGLVGTGVHMRAHAVYTFVNY